MASLTGRLIAGRFRVDALVGSGGVGAVYRATQQPLGRTVALKLLHPDMSASPAVRTRFAREARAIGSLAHPNIAIVHDFGVDDEDIMFMAMEFVDGTSLADLHGGDRPLPFNVLRVLFEQILSAAQHAHSRGVIHRDIKPANVLVTNDLDGNPVAKLVDFGIAVVGEEPVEEPDGTIRVVGTPHFMAPEQARGERHLTPAVDIYSIGLMLFWAVTGRHAFDAASSNEVMRLQCEAPVPAVSPRTGVRIPVGLEGLIVDALHKNPRERIPSAAEFRARLRALSGAVDTQVERVGAPVIAVRADRRTLMDTRPRTLHEARPRTLLEEPGAPASARRHTIAEGREGDAPAPRVSAAASVRTEVPLIGREEDREILVEAGNKVLGTGRGVVILLEGEAGIGKSTLARWFLDHLADSGGFRVARGSFHREGEHSLRGVREAFESLLGTRGLDAAGIATRVRAQLAELGLGDRGDAELLTAFLRSTASDDEAPDPAVRRAEALHETLLRVLEAASRQSPIALHLDDVHWAGRETAAFLEFLAAELLQRPCRVVLLATLQHEDARTLAVEALLGEISRHQGTSVLRRVLSRLDLRDARQLIAAMLNASRELADTLVERAGGNPMHLVQLVRYLRDEHLIEPGSGGWVARAGVNVTDILPPSLVDTIDLRITQVTQLPGRGPRLKDLLDRSAILGTRFRFSILRRMLELEGRTDLLPSLDSDLDHLLDEDLLRMTERQDDDILEFPTGLIRDVILQPMRGRRMTRKLHLDAAEAKINVLGATADRAAIELVAHFQAARESTRELEWTWIAAQVAERTHRPTDALALQERALALLDNVDAASTRSDLALPSRPAVILRMANLRVGLGEYERAREDFAEVARLSQDAPSLENRIRALYGQADVALNRAEFASASALYAEGADLAAGVDDAALQTRGFIGRARVESQRGNHERARALAGEALSLARSSSDTSQVPEVLWLLGEMARARGEIAEAEHLFNEALGRYRAIDHRRGIADCLARLAVTARMRNDLDRATARYQDALEIYRTLGARRELAHQLNGLGDVARFRGDHALATEHYRRAVDTFQALGIAGDAATALTNLGIVARDAGNHLEADDAFRRALGVSSTLGYPYLILGVKFNYAWHLIQNDRDEQGLELVLDAIATADETGLVDPDFATPLERIADALSDDGRVDEATRIYRRSLQMWEELDREQDADRIRLKLRDLP